MKKPGGLGLHEANASGGRKEPECFISPEEVKEVEHDIGDTDDYKPGINYSSQEASA
jgi:hypothetical protein